MQEKKNPTKNFVCERERVRERERERENLLIVGENKFIVEGVNKKTKQWNMKGNRKNDINVEGSGEMKW